MHQEFAFDTGCPAAAETQGSTEECSPAAQRRNHAGSRDLVQLIDPSGVTWLRHFCRSCRKTPLWAVLGEPTPMCRECIIHSLRSEPLGYERKDRVPTELQRHERQYHGDSPYSES